MALINRISRLLRADLHAVLDRVEEPELLLRQAVRDMEEELAREERHYRMLSNEQAQLDTRRQQLDRRLSEIDDELDVCFESEKDDLSRALIRRKLETQRLHRLLSQKRQDLESTLAGLKRRISENRAHLEATRQKAEVLLEEDRFDRPDDSWATPDISIQDEDVEVAFIREKKRRVR